MAHYQLKAIEAKEAFAVAGSLKHAVERATGLRGWDAWNTALAGSLKHAEEDLLRRE